MNALLLQQRQLLSEKIAILHRLEAGLRWSLERLPPLDARTINDPAIGERLSAIVDRYCKLQDQLAATLRHAHLMLGEKNRGFQDVVAWAVTQHIIETPESWLEMRSLRNRLTHEYDLADARVRELVALVRESHETLAAAVARLVATCAHAGLLT